MNTGASAPPPGAPHAVAHRADEIADLRGLADVAGKQDEAPGLLVAVEGGFVGGQRLAARTKDHGFRSVQVRPSNAFRNFP